MDTDAVGYMKGAANKMAEWIGAVATIVTVCSGMLLGAIAWCWKVERHLLIVSRAFHPENPDAVPSRLAHHSDRIEQLSADVNGVRIEMEHAMAILTIVKLDPDLQKQMAAIATGMRSLAERQIKERVED